MKAVYCAVAVSLGNTAFRISAILLYGSRANDASHVRPDHGSFVGL